MGWEMLENSWWLQPYKRQRPKFLPDVIHNPKVGGSIPPPATIPSLILNHTETTGRRGKCS